MSDQYKKSTQAALEKYLRKQIKKPRSNKNKSPEKLVVKQLLQWLGSNGFLAYVVESKATYSQTTGAYTNQQAMSGMSDIIGVTPDGFALFVEAKARGRRSTLKSHQEKFLTDCISHHAFACCVDSVDLLSKIYSEWLASNKDASVLLKHLPTKKVSHRKDQNPNPDLGF